MDLWDEPSSAADFGIDELVDLPMRWLERLVDYLPDWPTTWIPDGPPDWLIDLIEKYAPVLEKYLPSSYIQNLIQMGLPHFYVQQNMCEKAFDIGVLVLTLGSLLVGYFLLRRCLATTEAGYRYSTDSYVCEWCRAEKSEVLPEELVTVEKRVESLKSSCQTVNKKLLACLQGQGTDGPTIDKRMKKLPEMALSGCMCESSAALGDTIFGNILGMCGKVQKLLGNELLEYETEVEKKVISKQSEILENDIPGISKQRKQLAKLTLDMDSARTRYQTASRHSIQAGNNAAKADVIKEEMEDASQKVEQCRDTLVGDMFNLLSKESEFAQQLVALVKIQSQYHKKALAILETYTRHMEEEINNSSCRPVYGCKLEDHLKVTDRHIALPIEVCVCFLAEYCMSEEGLFRIAGSASKLKKLKAAFDANVWEILDMSDYIKDPHAVAGALKMYLRELPTPLMTHVLYSEWMQAARISDPETRLKALWNVVQKMPVPYYNNLKYLMKFLNKLTASQETTKMTAQNLAIVMAPNLIWSPDEGSSTLGVNMSLANTYSLIVDSLIANADYFFPGDVEFYLPSPILKSPHDSFGSTSGNLNYVDAESIIPANGDIQSGLQISDGSLLPMQPSPQMGGSPKSLRRSKKPAPPAPAVRERPSITPEKIVNDRPTVVERTPEKIVPEKPIVERKLSTSSDKSSSPSGSVSARSNHFDRGVIAPEKPQIPEKPSFVEKRSNDLKPSVPIPAERHHIERAQNSVPPVERAPLAVSEITSPPVMLEESRPPLPEIVPPRVEYESEEDDDRPIVSRRGRSLLHTERFDHYRPNWYGDKDLANGQQQEEEEEEEKPPAPKLTLEEEMLKISQEAQRLMEEKLKSYEPFRIESILKDESSSELSDTSSSAKEAAVASEEVEECILDRAEVSSEPEPSDEKVKEIEPEEDKTPEPAPSPILIEPDVLGNIVLKKDPVQLPRRLDVKPVPRLFSRSPERRMISDELIVIDLPPHSMQFVKPSEAKSCEDVSKTPKERVPVRQQVSFDFLGNLTFLSQVPEKKEEPEVMKELPTEMKIDSYMVESAATERSESTGKILDSADVTPERIVEICKSVEDIPESAGQISESIGEIPESVGEISESVIEIPESVIEIPESVDEIPQSISEILEIKVPKSPKEPDQEKIEGLGEIRSETLEGSQGYELVSNEKEADVADDDDEWVKVEQQFDRTELPGDYGLIHQAYERAEHVDESARARREYERAESEEFEKVEQEPERPDSEEFEQVSPGSERADSEEFERLEQEFEREESEELAKLGQEPEDDEFEKIEQDIEDNQKSAESRGDLEDKEASLKSYADRRDFTWEADAEMTAQMMMDIDKPAYDFEEPSYKYDSLTKDDFSTSLFGAEGLMESESPQTIKGMDTPEDDYVRRSSDDFSYLSSSNYPLRRERRYYGTESRSDSVTDSDDWNSERSASPEKPLRLAYSGRQVSTESKSSDDYERMESPFHFRYRKKSPFAMRAERPLSPYRSVAERPLSPISKSQSVPSTPPPEKSRHLREFTSSSYEPLHTKSSSVDAWFADTAQPVAKPRRQRRRASAPSSRPKRPPHPPARPPNLPIVIKPKRPDKPPPPENPPPPPEKPPPPPPLDRPLPSAEAEMTMASVETVPVPESSKASTTEEKQIPSSKRWAPKAVDEPWASFSELDVELQPLISRGMLLARGSSPSVRSQFSKQSSASSRERVDAGVGMSTQAVQGSPAVPKRPPRPQPPPPPPPFKSRTASSAEDTHL